MNASRLIKMANQIGTFFEAMPDVDQRVTGISEHIEKFWEPRMQMALANHIASHSDDELKPDVRLAVARMRRD